jgi:3'(2'), 5'-bisphosphate nucleotidase
MSRVGRNAGGIPRPAATARPYTGTCYTGARDVQAYQHELAVAEAAARRAGDIIMTSYRAGDARAETKDDGSPVSQVDRAANAAIEAALAGAFPGDAILSEESPDDLARLGRERVWIVDPLDGTRGFLARTDDFCVHVALAVAGAPAVGVVFRPVTGALYAAVAGQGAFVQAADGQRARLAVSQRADVGDLRIGISRHHAPPALLAWLEERGLAGRVVHSGASTKWMAVAEGTLDAVVTITASEKEWDTCAPELIVREAGGAVSGGDGAAFRYNRRELGRRHGIVASNHACHAPLLAAMAGLFADQVR